MKTDNRLRPNKFVLAIAAAATAPAFAATSCESLANHAFPNTTILAAQTLPAGPTTIIGTTAPGTTAPVYGTFSGTLPVPICRVRGSIKPTSVSNIIFEVWLPLSNWNGKFNGVGNGGTAGSLGLKSMLADLARGYATAVTDTGHQSSDSSFAMVSPELIEDFAHRGYHLTTQVGKLITTAFYGTAPRYSYFTGCSTGGAEALSEAQRYPDDYDGIVAGAPANHYTKMWPGEVFPSWVAQADPVGLTAKLPALNAAAVAACDATDGLVDGLVSDPRKCHWDPATIQCTAGDNPSCLTPAQVSMVRQIYGGFKDPTTGKQIWPPYMRGSEDQWGGHITQNNNPPVNYFRYFVYLNPNWYYTDPLFNMNSLGTVQDIYTADAKFVTLLDSIDPDLRSLQKKGAKLIMYHGWKDQNIAPLNSINYYESVVDAVAGRHGDSDGHRGDRGDDEGLRKTQTFARLFMVPGMQHCGGGPGPNTFDSLGALEQWVENGVAPDKMIASHSNAAGVVDRTRPLCVYPKVATYTGRGSIDDAANFVCREEDREDH